MLRNKKDPEGQQSGYAKGERRPEATCYVVYSSSHAGRFQQKKVESNLTVKTKPLPFQLLSERQACVDAFSKYVKTMSAQNTCDPGRVVWLVVVEDVGQWGTRQKQLWDGMGWGKNKKIENVTCFDFIFLRWRVRRFCQPLVILTVFLALPYVCTMRSTFHSLHFDPWTALLPSESLRFVLVSKQSGSLILFSREVYLWPCRLYLTRTCHMNVPIRSTYHNLARLLFSREVRFASCSGF